MGLRVLGTEKEVGSHLHDKVELAATARMQEASAKGSVPAQDGWMEVRLG